MKQIRNSLGIIFYEQTVAVSEVESTGDTCQVRRCAEFEMPDGMTIENIALLQPEFGAFLKENGFKCRKAVVGISAKQIVSTLLKIPPIEDVQTRQATIKLHLERKLEMDFSKIVFDCWDCQDKNNDAILAMMTLKKKVTAIKSLLSGLKITPLWMTSSSLGLDLSTTAGIDCNIVNFPESLEVFIFQNRNLSAILNISKKTQGVFDSELADEVFRQINRVLWSLSIEKNQPNYTVWTSNSDATTVVQQLGKVLDDLELWPINALDGVVSQGNLCDVAAQLACNSIVGDSVNINFLNGHHQAKASLIPKQWRPRIAIAVAVVFLLLGLYFYGWYADSTAIVRYQQDLDSMSENVFAAEKMIDQVGFAKQWFGRKPMHLDNLSELTMAFPVSSEIWLTSLAVDPSLNQVIAGRATNEDAILDVVDTLKANPLFKDIQLLYIRKMGKNTDVMTFAINFNCRGEQ
jgi:hypothetical protein